MELLYDGTPANNRFVEALRGNTVKIGVSTDPMEAAAYIGVHLWEAGQEKLERRDDFGWLRAWQTRSKV